MIIGQVSVHDVEADDPVGLRRLERSQTWCLSIGDVDFYATQLDALLDVFARVHAAIDMGART